MKTLQKDLKLYRFDNRKPLRDFLHPQRFEYCLIGDTGLIRSEYSDNEFRMGLVTIEPGKLARLELVNEVRDVEMDDENTFIVNTEIPNNHLKTI